MAKLIIEGITAKQAKELARWFEGQGEQDAVPWFEANDVECPMSDCSRKDGCIITDKNGNVTLYCK